MNQTISQKSITAIKSTIPLLEEHGEAITQSFYQRMFKAHPYLKNIFNQTNQVSGDQSQSLRNAIVAYAQNIDNLDILTPAITRIAHKHASLNIQPNQYPIVGENLLLAIADVLGLPKEHIALKAWGEAYQALANILINAEKKLYEQSSWQGFKEFYIAKTVEETAEVKSLYLQPLDKETLPSFKAGQFVGLQVRPNNMEYLQIRQYSITAADKESIRISVKREPNGSVSNYLHNAQIGDAVRLLPPKGVFTLLDNKKKKVFISGGIGITPLFSMLNELLQTTPDSKVIFIQAAKNERTEIFKTELSALQTKHDFIYHRHFSEQEGHLNKLKLKALLTTGGFSGDNAEVYLCGSKAFMHDIKAHCITLGFNESDIHFEVFGPTVEV